MIVSVRELKQTARTVCVSAHVYLFGGLCLSERHLQYCAMFCSEACAFTKQDKSVKSESLITAEQKSFGTMAMCKTECKDMQDAASRL